jgi:hypothetical protein
MSDWSEYWRNRKLIEDIALKNTIDRRMSLQDWEIFLNSLSHYSYLARRIRNWYSFLMWLLIAMAFFSGILMRWLVLICSVLLLILVIIQRRKIHTFDFSKNIQTFVIPFIYYLRNDVWEDTILHLQIDLNPRFNAGTYDKKKSCYIFEWMRGKMVPITIQEALMQFGWMLLIFLLLFVTYRDILRFFSGS